MSADSVTWVLLALYGTITLVLLTNMIFLVVTRRRIVDSFPGRLSVIIPARNEERNLERLLPSLLAQRGVAFEVIVYDDASEDGTGRVVREIGDPRVRLIDGTGPPPGWIGKVHALYQASQVATGDALLFLDADTRFMGRDGLAEIARRFAALPDRSVLTALPRFRGGAALLVSLVPYGLLTNLPLPVAERWGGRRLAALNGQCWMIRRQDYLAHDPHLRHRGEVLEDVRIGQYLASRGLRPRFADLKTELEVWMYAGMGDAWRGFRKNAYLLLGGRMLPFLFFFSLYVLTFVAAPIWSLGWLGWAMATKLASDRFCRIPLWVSVAAPVTFGLWTALLLDSAWSHTVGRVEWKGRDVKLGPSR